MSRSKVEGTKIAQAAKDLNVTSVTIRRYIQEFEIDTDTDENGIKVLPSQALLELQEIRRLKEDGLTNPKVMELLEELRTKKAEAKPAKTTRATRAKVTSRAKAKEEVEKVEELEEEEEEEEIAKPKASLKSRGKTISSRGKRAKQDKEEKPAEEEEEESKLETASELSKDEEEGEGGISSEEGAEGERSKHALTCQTCGKNFEHMNPRLRDCLDCYRAKRKERRRGSDKHKRVIENPIAQQVLSRQAKVEGQPLTDKATSPVAFERPDRLERADRPERGERPERSERPERPERADRNDRAERLEKQERLERERQEARAIALASQPRHQDPTPWAQMQKPVRSYRKAIEETRLITGSLKRRLERPDLPEGERRWLEQVYAYQLILHQGWRHLAEYKSGGIATTKTED